MQGTISRYTPRGVFLHIDVQSADGKVNTVAGFVPKSELPMGDSDSVQDVVRVRLLPSMTCGVSILVCNLRARIRPGCQLCHLQAALASSALLRLVQIGLQQASSLCAVAGLSNLHL